MSRKKQFEVSEIYHIYNRGTEKRVIFQDDADHWWFIHLLYHCNQPDRFNKEMIDIKRDLRMPRSETLVDIGTYCLMPNHFHILVREKAEGNMSKFMQKVCTAYSMYFNAKYERTGRLFEGAFKAKHIDTDEYLQHVFAYICLNPIKLRELKWKENLKSDCNLVTFVEEYPFSGTKDLLGLRSKYLPILNPGVFPIVANSPLGVHKLLEWWSSAGITTQ